MGFCNWSLFCCALPCFHTSFAIFSMEKRELVALLCFSSLCGSFTRCHGFDCSFWWWYFLIILTYYFSYHWYDLDVKSMSKICNILKVALWLVTRSPLSYLAKWLLIMSGWQWWFQSTYMTFQSKAGVNYTEDHFYGMYCWQVLMGVCSYLAEWSLMVYRYQWMLQITYVTLE